MLPRTSRSSAIGDVSWNVAPAGPRFRLPPSIEEPDDDLPTSVRSPSARLLRASRADDASGVASEVRPVSSRLPDADEEEPTTRRPRTRDLAATIPAIPVPTLLGLPVADLSPRGAPRADDSLFRRRPYLAGAILLMAMNVTAVKLLAVASLLLHR
jgi:hypothetical protein